MNDAQRAKVFLAAAALAECLSLIGNIDDGSDRRLAQIFCDNETPIRALMNFIIETLGRE